MAAFSSKIYTAFDDLLILTYNYCNKYDKTQANRMRSALHLRSNMWLLEETQLQKDKEAEKELNSQLSFYGNLKSPKRQTVAFYDEILASVCCLLDT